MREDKKFYRSFYFDWRKSRLSGSFLEKAFQNSRLKAIRKSLDVKGKTLLDIGCNTGVFTFEIAESGSRTFGFDISGSTIAKAARYADEMNSSARFFTADMENIPLKGDSVDIALITATLDHTKEPERAIEEIRRVLKPGGVVFVEVTFKYALVNSKIVRKIFSAQKTDEKEDYWRASFFYSYTPRQVKDLFSEFETVRLWLGSYGNELFGIFRKSRTDQA